MTKRVPSSRSTQYRVRMLRIVCLAKNVRVNPWRSAMSLLLPSAHQLVNAQVLTVRFVLSFFLGRVVFE